MIGYLIGLRGHLRKTAETSCQNGQENGLLMMEHLPGLGHLYMAIALCNNPTITEHLLSADER